MSDEYWRSFWQTLSKFREGNETLRWAENRSEPGSTCEMCGHYPISDVFVFDNVKTKVQKKVGSECARNIIFIVGSDLSNKDALVQLMRRDDREKEVGLTQQEIQYQLEQHGIEFDEQYNYYFSDDGV